MHGIRESVEKKIQEGRGWKKCSYFNLTILKPQGGLKFLKMRELELSLWPFPTMENETTNLALCVGGLVGGECSDSGV